MNTFEVSGFHGKNTPVTILVVAYGYSTKWYCVKGSPIANKTHDPIEEGVNVDELSDCSMLYHGTPINTLEELMEA
jgi:hypothetical protein